MSQAAHKIGFVSLGCPKALVDSERILTQLKVEGYQIVPSYGEADAVVVNTCGFIDAAVQESLDSIGEALNENGKVIVTGCLGKREELIREAYPDVLSISGPQDYVSVMNAVHAALPPTRNKFLDIVPDIGVKLTPKHYAYLKISEGCNHRCSFCIIPSMRGNLVSRPVNEVLIEAEKLVKGGVKELLVISQDTSAYGVDVKYAEHEWRGKSYRTRMTELCEGLAELGVWVRLHYVYPYPHVDELMPLMAAGRILPYLDIPFQHASPRILKLMKRPGNIDKTLERIRNWRKVVPNLTIRSTFIVGFPGETDEEFEELLMNDARYPWLILVPRRAGLVELTDLDGTEQSLLWQEVKRASAALRSAAPCDKLNVGVLGNIVRQLHVHVVGRREGDQAWPGPVWGSGESAPYASDDLAAFVRVLKTVLAT